jgi:Inner membrane protein YgaP-like, transmembrane domain
MKSFLSVTQHPVERVIRVIAGLVLLSLVFVGPQTPWGWIGVIPILTGLSGLCPLYSLLGISTSPKKSAN